MARPEKNKAQPKDYSITLKNVHFGYRRKEVLHGISIEIPSGSVCALTDNRQKAYVSQDNYLFDDTVRENIRMGRTGASDAEVEVAARFWWWITEKSFSREHMQISCSRRVFTGNL